MVAVLPKTTREEVRIALCEFKGVPLLSLRVWFQPPGGGEKRPGRDGLALRIAQLPALAEALQQAVAEAQAEGLLPDKGGAG